MHIVVLGAGGVGGYIGARLIEGGADVSFLVHAKRAAQLAADGLVVKSPLGDFARPVRALASASDIEPAPDAVILACKEPALAGAMDAVAPLLGKDTRLLPVLNGVRHMETLAARFAAMPLLGGIAHGAVDLRPDGAIVHLSPFMRVICGPVAGAGDPVSAGIVGRLQAAGVEAEASPDILQDMWNKFVFLSAFAGITCLMRTNIGNILKTDGGRARILQLLEETRAVAEAEGFPPPAALMEEYRALLTQEGSSFASSMLRDIEAGRRTEGAHILGDMLQRARRHGLSAPLLAIAAAHVEAYECQLDERAAASASAPD
ncbi:MAG TPA: 2-dehydropantoate 2-reductase [Hyphomicrobium sp.]|nr:2-dehydropantoate 2-reductase [Hyphomicrobium sp.]